MCTGGLARRPSSSAAAAFSVFGDIAPRAPSDKHASAVASTTVLFSSSDVADAHAAVEATATANAAEYAVKAKLDASCVEPVNRFSSRTVPPLSLHQLGSIMARNTKCGDESLMEAVVLVTRYCETTHTALTMKMAHRLYITALHVAIKTHSDRFFRNDAFAMLAGVTCRELGLLEAEFVRGLDWRCLVQAHDITAMIVDPTAYARSSIPRTPDTAATTTAAAASSSSSDGHFVAAANRSADASEVASASSDFGASRGHSAATSPSDSV